MTEQEWLASEDPQRMLSYLTGDGAHYAVTQEHGPLQCCTSRQLRLFACACARQVWLLLTDPRSREAVEVAERYADGGEYWRIVDAHNGAAHAFEDAGPARGSFEAELALRCSGDISLLTANSGLPRWFSVSTKLAAAQANLLREIHGNPFRPVPFDPDWRTPTVLALAQAAYEDRQSQKCQRCRGNNYPAQIAPEKVVPLMELLQMVPVQPEMSVPTARALDAWSEASSPLTASGCWRMPWMTRGVVMRTFSGICADASGVVIARALAERKYPVVSLRRARSGFPVRRAVARGRLP